MGSVTKSVGSLSQRLFESDDNDEESHDELDERSGSGLLVYNGYSKSFQPGSKSNPVLCNECDLRNRTCGIRAQIPNDLAGSYVEERLQHGCVRGSLEDEDSEDSPACAKCESGIELQHHCSHCELSKTDEGDLICFSCQGELMTLSSCCCQQPNEMHVAKVPSDRMQLNNRSINKESDETTTTTGESETGALVIPLATRLATIVEAKGDTTPSENDDEAPKRLNGTTQPKLLNYKIVLLL